MKSDHRALRKNYVDTYGAPVFASNYSAIGLAAKRWTNSQWTFYISMCKMCSRYTHVTNLGFASYKEKYQKKILWQLKLCVTVFFASHYLNLSVRYAQDTNKWQVTLSGLCSAQWKSSIRLYPSLGFPKFLPSISLRQINCKLFSRHRNIIKDLL